ncbi:MAG TPA: hypothetical protein VKU44_00750 [Terriglobia bacterium]|nr:hypothetical protein [Terriglobia bacterium]
MPPKPTLHVGILEGRPDEEPMPEGEGDSMDGKGYALACHECMSAMHANDADKFGAALRSACKILYSEMEKGEGEGDEGEPPPEAA